MTEVERAEWKLLKGIFSDDHAEYFNVVDGDGLRKSAIKTTKQEVLDEDEKGAKERWTVDIDWRLLNKWYGVQK